MPDPATPAHPSDSKVRHASCVALNRRAVLIEGPSGSGKSALALRLMAYGARLVADDRTQLRARQGVLFADSPSAIHGLIEARGVGLLIAETERNVPVALCVDLAATEIERLPPLREITILGCRLPLIRGVGHAHFADAILQYLKGGRQA